MKKIIKGVLTFFVVALILFLGYAGYVFGTYKRLDDNLRLAINGEWLFDALDKEKTYSIATYNVGFGAYLPDYSFFMDGGKYSWAKDKESVKYAINGVSNLILSKNPDFALVQELDKNGTRSYHVNEYKMMEENLKDYCSVFAQNYDSAFLMYPLTQPHGKNKSGICTFSRYKVNDAMRRSLPISTSLSKVVDLDRCYSVSKIPLDNGDKELVIFNVHLSAYGNSDKIRQGQVNMLNQDMKAEYDKGNYVICGGDFNHDLKAAEGNDEKRASWAYPYPRTALPKSFRFAMDFLNESEKANLWNSARNADMEYIEGETYTLTLDGFIISDNIEMISYETINTGYAYADHEMVYMQFKLK